MKPVGQARMEMNAARAKGEHDEWSRQFGMVVETGMKLKAVMIAKGLTQAKTKCPKCNGVESLHGRLLIGQAAGRHRRSGGAFRMWCDTCPDIRMME